MISEDKIKLIKNLSFGWKSGNGVPINQFAIDTASKLDEVLSSILTADVYPNEDGSLEFVIYGETRNAILTILYNNTVKLEIVKSLNVRSTTTKTN